MITLWPPLQAHPCRCLAFVQSLISLSSTTEERHVQRLTSLLLLSHSLPTYNTSSSIISTVRRLITGDHGVANAHARLNGPERQAAQPLRSPVAPHNSPGRPLLLLHIHARCAAERGLFGLLVSREHTMRDTRNALMGWQGDRLEKDAD